MSLNEELDRICLVTTVIDKKTETYGFECFFRLC